MSCDMFGVSGRTADLGEKMLGRYLAGGRGAWELQT